MKKRRTSSEKKVKSRTKYVTIILGLLLSGGVLTSLFVHWWSIVYFCSIIGFPCSTIKLTLQQFDNNQYLGDNVSFDLTMRNNYEKNLLVNVNFTINGKTYHSIKCVSSRGGQQNSSCDKLPIILDGNSVIVNSYIMRINETAGYKRFCIEMFNAEHDWNNEIVCSDFNLREQPTAKNGLGDS